MLTGNISDVRTSINTQVLIIGGGPVGLAVGIELGLRGIRCMIIEPREKISKLKPRAKTTNVRSMEHFRRWGIADQIRKAAPLSVEWSQEVVFCTQLMGCEITRFKDVFGLTSGGSELFAESGQQIPQFCIEQVLREKVESLPNVDLVVGWRLQSFSQDEQKVRASIIHEEGGSRKVEADYLIGCDGSRSVVRKQIGAFYEGETDYRSNFNFTFRAPGLAERMPHGPAVSYWIINEKFPGVMGRLDLDDTWWGVVLGADTQDGNVDLERFAYGLIGERVPIEVLATDPWTARMLLANRFRVGRVFLAGDAAHLNPPWGGHGFNTGLGDAVDLGWKLAAALDGWAGTRLLDSYEAERRPMSARVIREASKNMGVLSNNLVFANLEGVGSDAHAARLQVEKKIKTTKAEEFYSLGLVLGHLYENSPIVVDDGTPVPPEEVVTFHPTARPGARLPHVWLADGQSVFDKLGSGFTLIRLDGRNDPKPLVEAAFIRNVPLEIVTIEREDLRTLYQARLVLVRPDQHVAWRGDALPDDPYHLIDVVRGAN